ncbi:MAG: tRNA (adenosine(37)-N6)-threonylcarbamoyltransferase complex transferase subunit TsaD [Brevinematia bacterium]
MIILGIETSCDETSASLVEDGKKIVSLYTFSQAEIHKDFDGVVPEVASRNHLARITEVLEGALKGFDIDGVDVFAATSGPGLIGSLLVGTNTAKSLSLFFNKPYVPVNHILAHMYTPHIENEIPFPYIGLVASGGHTILFLVRSYYDIEFLGSTIDDAIGEAFDKIAKYFKLGYPGGPVIDKLSQKATSFKIKEFEDIPLPLPEKKDRYNFSYSGLKTAIIYRAKKTKIDETDIPYVVKRFQDVAIKHLLDKTLNAVNDTGIKRVVISGGVSGNSFLRKQLEMLKEERRIDFYTASLKLCSDNAAMVAGRAYVDYINKPDSFDSSTLRSVVFSRLDFIKKGKRR